MIQLCTLVVVFSANCLHLCPTTSGTHETALLISIRQGLGSSPTLKDTDRITSSTAAYVLRMCIFVCMVAGIVAKKNPFVLCAHSTLQASVHALRPVIWTLAEWMPLGMCDTTSSKSQLRQNQNVWKTGLTLARCFMSRLLMTIYPFPSRHGIARSTHVSCTLSLNGIKSLLLAPQLSVAWVSSGHTFLSNARAVKRFNGQGFACSIQYFVAMCRNDDVRLSCQCCLLPKEPFVLWAHRGQTCFMHVLGNS